MLIRRMAAMLLLRSFGSLFLPPELMLLLLLLPLLVLLLPLTDILLQKLSTLLLQRSCSRSRNGGAANGGVGVGNVGLGKKQSPSCHLCHRRWGHLQGTAKKWFLHQIAGGSACMWSFDKHVPH